MVKALNQLQHMQWHEDEMSFGIQFLTDGSLPQGMGPNRTITFKAKFRPLTLMSSQDAKKLKIALPDLTPKLQSYLAHKLTNPTDPTDQSIRIVVPREQVSTVLGKLYLDIKTAYKSRDPLFGYVTKHYIGITCADCAAFVRNHEATQIHSSQREAKVKRPIISTRPRERWQIDGVEIVINESTENKKQVLADNNNGFRYCYTVIDHFTKFAWVIPTRTKKQSEWVPKLSKIIDKFGAPTIIQGDNEFRGEGTTKFARLMRKHEIAVENSMPYRPNTNGAIERFNRTLKNKIAFVFTTYDTARWIAALKDIVYNYNHSVHSTTGFTPAELEDPLAPTQTMLLREQLAGERLAARARKMIRNNTSYKKLPKVRVGDIVRISHRPEIDKFRTKILPYRWSIPLYIVTSVKHGSGQPAFTVQRRVGNRHGGQSKHGGRTLYRDELLLVDPTKLDTTNYQL